MISLEYCFCRSYILAGLVFFFLSGCVPPNYYPPPSPPPSSQAIGQLEAKGSNVFYNYKRTPGGHTIQSGDNVRTGGSSRAIIRLNGGGVVTLDENTDPDFIQEAWCILVKILKGQVSTDGPGICFDTPHASGVINSVVNIEVNNRETIITVLTGSVNLKQPAHLQIQSSEQVRIVRGRIQSVRLLSESELGAVFEWIYTRPGRSAASTSRYCQSYAQTAVSQQSENKERRCGFSGGRWSSDFRLHYNWCMQAPQSMAENENRARMQDLRTQCSPVVSQPDNRQRCQRYAQTAIAHQAENVKRRCGFSGGRWSSDYKLHYNWCMQAPKSMAYNENKIRVKDLRRCPGVVK